MKEIDQRNKDNLHIPCNCGFGSHHLDFDYFVDDFKFKDEKGNKTKKPKNKNIWKHYYISIVSPSQSFWYKLKNCYDYLFKEKELCRHDIGITSKDIVKIKKHFDKYLEL